MEVIHMNGETWFSNTGLKINETKSLCGIIKIGEFDCYIGRVTCTNCIKIYAKRNPDYNRRP